jgi:hypothetical protein
MADENKQQKIAHMIAKVEVADNLTGLGKPFRPAANPVAIAKPTSQDASPVANPQGSPTASPTSPKT